MFSLFVAFLETLRPLWNVVVFELQSLSNHVGL